MRFLWIFVITSQLWIQCTADQWGSWSEWTKCTRSCGTGSKHRSRTCRNCGPKGQSGVQQALEKCNTQTCLTTRQKQIPFRRDFPQTAHQKNAAVNSQYRGGVNQPSGNYGPPPNPSTYQSAAWGQWTPWTNCAASCGTSQKSRSRPCVAPRGGQCSGQATEQMQCNLGSCCQSWTSWSSCSATCGYGTQSRTQTCGSGGGGSGTYGQPSGSNTNTQDRQCNSGPCATWGNWGSWTSCSQSCGDGIRTRTRSCTGGGACQGPSVSETLCNQSPCPSWSDWNEWGSCSTTCGSGSQSRSRNCQYGSACSGSTSDTQSCNYGSCPTWGTWTTWSSCSETCTSSYGGGNAYQTRSRTCSGSGNCVGGSSEQRNCIPSPPQCAQWGGWTGWSSCSATCSNHYGSGGSQSRSRTCSGSGSCDDGESSDTRDCQPAPEPCATWTPWGPWEQCSLTCTPGYGQAGTQSRSRSCEGAGSCDGVEGDGRVCQPPAPLCPSWGPWGPWSNCPLTCIGGGGSPGGYGNPSSFTGGNTGSALITRTRPCKGSGGCVGQSSNSQDCASQLPACSSWSQWGAWGSCSVSCIGGGGYGQNSNSGSPGSQIRSRSCTGGGNCIGPSSENKSCQNLPQCSIWGNWQPWSGCSVTCGSGVDRRVRSCSGVGGCSGQGDESRNCQLRPCGGGGNQGGYYGGNQKFYRDRTKSG